MSEPGNGLKVPGLQGSLLWAPAGQWKPGGHLYPWVPSEGEGTTLPSRQMYLKKWGTIVNFLQDDISILARLEVELTGGRGHSPALWTTKGMHLPGISDTCWQWVLADGIKTKIWPDCRGCEDSRAPWTLGGRCWEGLWGVCSSDLYLRDGTLGA